MAFTGFTTDKLVGLPPELFSEVLPQITLPSELKITLHVFYRMSRQRGPAPRRVSWDELAGDKTLRRGLRAISKLRPPDELLSEGLDAGISESGMWSLAHHDHTSEPSGAISWKPSSVTLIFETPHAVWPNRVRLTAIR